MQAQQGIVGEPPVRSDPQPLHRLRPAPFRLQGSSPMWRWSMGWGWANQSPRVSR